MDTMITRSDKPSPTLIVEQITGYGIEQGKAKGLLLFFQSYQVLLEEIAAQEKIVAAWEEKPRCYGTKSYKNRMYLHINHSPVQYRDHGPCPNCGWGKDTSKRHYPYVGNDPVREDEAVMAMKNWDHWQAQRVILVKLRTRLQTMDRAITSLLAQISIQKSLL